MIELEEVIATTEVNRKNISFTKEALMSCAEQINSRGSPHLIAHDRTKLVGWCYRSRVEQDEAGYWKLMAQIYVPETEEEFAQIRENYAFFMEQRFESQTESFREYPKRFSDPVPLLTSDMACVYLCRPNITFDIFPWVQDGVDRDGLVGFNDFKLIGDGFIQEGEYLLVPHRFFRKSFSISNLLNRDFLGSVSKLARETKESIKLKVDPDFVGIADSLKEFVELDYWWGPKFDQDLLNIDLGVTRHVTREGTIERIQGLLMTEFFIYSREGKRVVQIEELSESRVKTSFFTDCPYAHRYIHTVVDETTGAIEHVDGSYRFYSEEKWNERISSTIDKAGRADNRAKLFRLDAPISVENWYSLIHTFYKDNTLIAEYFGLEITP